MNGLGTIIFFGGRTGGPSDGRRLRHALRARPSSPRAQLHLGRFRAGIRLPAARCVAHGLLAVAWEGESGSVWL